MQPPKEILEEIISYGFYSYFKFPNLSRHSFQPTDDSLRMALDLRDITEIKVQALMNNIKALRLVNRTFKALVDKQIMKAANDLGGRLRRLDGANLRPEKIDKFGPFKLFHMYVAYLRHLSLPYIEGPRLIHEHPNMQLMTLSNDLTFLGLIGDEVINVRYRMMGGYNSLIFHDNMAVRVIEVSLGYDVGKIPPVINRPICNWLEAPGVFLVTFYIDFDYWPEMSFFDIGKMMRGSKCMDIDIYITYKDKHLNRASEKLRMNTLDLQGLIKDFGLIPLGQMVNYYMIRPDFASLAHMLRYRHQPSIKTLITEILMYNYIFRKPGDEMREKRFYNEVMVDLYTKERCEWADNDWPLGKHLYLIHRMQMRDYGLTGTSKK